MKTIQSTCNFCSLACGLDFVVDEGKIIGVNANKAFPVNKGKACIKGLNLDKQTQKIKPKQLPTINGESVSYDQAFTYVADKLLALKEEFGGDAIAGLSTGQMPLEEMALLGHVMRNHLRANLDGNTRLCMATSVVAYKQSFGFDAPPYTLKDAEDSDTLILIGANPVVAHPVLWGRIKHSKRPGRKVIVIDPRRSETAKVSDYFYQNKPKSDNVLMYTIANYLISKDYIDHQYIEKHVNHFEQFKAFVSKYTLDDALVNTGISSEQIIEICEMINNGENVSFWWTMGINQSYDAVRTAQSIINLALITGNMGRPGTGANSITGQCNAMGSRAFSHQAGLFGGGDFTNEKRRAQICEALKITDEYLIDKPTKPYNAIIDGINAGEIKALWVICTNPKHSYTNSESFRQAAEKLDLLIVQDIFADTETARLADVYIPVVPAIKKEGTLINTERRLSPVRPVIAKEEGEMTDYEVIYEIGKKLNMGSNLDGWETPKDAFNLMKKCSKGMPLDITGVDYDQLTQGKGVQWPLPSGSEIDEDERRLFADGKYYTGDGRANLIFDEPIENPIPTTEQYPFVLNTGRGTVGQWHTSVRTREFDVVNDAARDHAYVHINQQDANDLAINENEQIIIESINGYASCVTAVISDSVNPGQIFAPMHYEETNKLTVAVFDPYSKEPSYKYAPVKISKSEDQ